MVDLKQAFASCGRHQYETQNFGVLSTSTPSHSGSKLRLSSRFPPQRTRSGSRCRGALQQVEGRLTLGLFFPEAQSDSARSKMLTGVGGFVLGLLALVMSVTLHFRGQRGKNLWKVVAIAFPLSHSVMKLRQKSKMTERMRPLKSDAGQAMAAVQTGRCLD